MPNSSCHFQSSKSVFLQILHHSSMLWKITPLYFFSSNNIYWTYLTTYAQNERIKVKIFETFECSAKNLSNSSCQFRNGNLIPLQILYLSSVSWNITTLYFFRWNNIYLMATLKRRINSSPYFASLLSFLKDNSSVIF